MIHLFNKVYLKIDRLIKDTRKRIVISEDWHNVGRISNDLMKRLQGLQPVAPIYSAPTYAALITEHFGGDEGRFIRDLLHDTSDERITIYVNVHELLVIYSRFLKTLYPSWTAAQFRQVIGLYTLVFRAMLGMGFLSYTKLPTTVAQGLAEEIDLYMGDEAFLNDLWTSAPVWPLLPREIERIVASTSLELQLPNLALNPRWRYATKATAKFVRMTQKHLVQEYISGVRNVILASLVNFQQIEPDSTFNIVEHTLQDLVDMHPDYAFLIDPKFVPEEIDYVLQQYDFDVLRRIYYKVMQSSQWNGEVYGELIYNRLSYQQVMDFEASNDKGRHLFRHGTYAETVNPYFIDAVIKAHQDNDTGFLQMLELKLRT